MNRRQFLTAAGTATGSILAPWRASGAAAAGESRPNIIVILADDLGYGDVGCYGQTRLQTPNLDRMAAQGMRFTQHYSGSTVCAPSRACLMLGLHTGHLQTPGQGQSLGAQDTTVAELLRRSGYATACIGKWGLGQEGSPGIPTQTGFEIFYGYLDQTHAHNYYPEFLWRGTQRVPLRNRVVRPDSLRERGFGGAASERVDYSHDLFTAEALSFVRQPRQQPFFLYLAYTIPHANNEAGVVKRHGMEVPDEGVYAQADWPAPQRAHAAMISLLDRDVGTLLDLLRELGLERETLVLFSSDNGPHKEGGADPAFFSSSGPLRGLKRDLYEGGIRVPTIAWWPGRVQAGTRSEHVSAFWDLLPTACDLARIPAPEGIDGLSFAPTLLGQPGQQEHPFLYWEFLEQGGKQALRFGPYKAIRLNLLQNPEGPIELYDVETDPGETTDLAARHVDAVARARELFAEVGREHPVRRPFDAPPPPTGAPKPLPPDVHLASLEPITATSGYQPLGPPKANRSIRGESLKIGGHTYAQGFGVHAPSQLVFPIRPEYKRFVAGAGPDDERPGSMVFEVYFDGVLAERSPLLTPQCIHYVDLPIPVGARQLRLVVTDGGDGNGGDHGDWVDAGFLHAATP